jgi:hypothetical protein
MFSSRTTKYRTLPIFKQDLTEGFELLVDPQDPVSSPLGWHNDGNTVSNDTSYVVSIISFHPHS